MEKTGIFIALVMGAIQGIFEWLPVSSHLVINYTSKFETSSALVTIKSFLRPTSLPIKV